MRLKNLIYYFLLIYGVSFLIVKPGFAQLQNWRYEIPVTITNNSGTVINNYPVLMRVNTRSLISAGYMQTDGRDIRFAYTCGGSLIDHTVESFINTDTTRIWIKMAYLGPYASITVFMYFGNPSASSGNTFAMFEGPYSSTNNVLVSNTGTVSNSQRGFRFSPTRDIIVTHFGKRVPNSTPRYVTLFDCGNQDIVAQLQVSGQSGIYNYNQLANFQWLQAGHQYIISVYQNAGDDYYFGVSSQIGQYLTYYEMRYRNNCTQNSYPNQSVLNYQYGVPDFMYYVRPDPINPPPSSTSGLAADTNTPTPPANLFAVGGNQTAVLKWNKNSEFDVVRYFIYMNTSDNPFSASLIDSTSQPDTLYTVTGLSYGTPYYFWVKAADRYCSRRISDFSNYAMIVPLNIPGQVEIPNVFALYQNYPNPFNPETEIKFDIPNESFVKLVIYDLLGREVAVLVNELKKPGKYSAKWDSENTPSGIYFYRLTAGNFEKTLRMVMLR